jgi:hypothetical protein
VPLDLARIAALARADWLERSRRPAFLVLLGIGLWSAWLFTPPNHAAYATFRMGGGRGEYGSAWIGATVAMLTAVFYSLAGFYVVKNAIAGDRLTRVGPVLASTPMRNAEYVLGKWIASTGLLAATTVVMLVGAGLMQWVRGEDPVIRPLTLAAPFLWIALPAMAVTAAIAVWFEATPGLRGGLGNVVYFFFWAAVLLSPGENFGTGAVGWDPLGVRMLVAEMLRAGQESMPGFRADSGEFSIGLNFRTGGWHLTTFPWQGIEWTPARVLERLGWLGAAALLAALAALPFDRFAEGSRAPGARPGGRRHGGSAAASAGEEAGVAALEPFRDRAESLHASVGSLAAVAPRFSGLTLVLAEWRLLVAGTSRWWWIAWLALQLPGLLAPLEVAARFAAIAWIWPVLHWSALGARDRVHGTTALLDASPHPVARQLPAALAAGAALALLAGVGFGARALAAGRWDVAAGWLAGAAFVPALALALGTLTGGRKTFEILYVVLWYVGPLNGARPVDFTGAAGGSTAPAFAAAALAALAIAAAARDRRLARG